LLLVCWTTTAGGTDSDGRQVTRRFENLCDGSGLNSEIVVKGTPLQTMRLLQWLDEIARVDKGCRTLMRISDSGHTLEIRHASYARVCAGRTRAPMTFNLVNGVGEDVEILFDASIPARGSHRVYNGRREQIEFTAVQNLYHELAHAMHLANGTWRYFDSEGQAIQEENIFRFEQARQQGRTPTERVTVAGKMILPKADARRHAN